VVWCVGGFRKSRRWAEAQKAFSAALSVMHESIDPEYGPVVSGARAGSLVHFNLFQLAARNRQFEPAIASLAAERALNTDAAIVSCGQSEPAFVTPPLASIYYNLAVCQLQAIAAASKAAGTASAGAGPSKEVTRASRWLQTAIHLNPSKQLYRQALADLRAKGVAGGSAGGFSRPAATATPSAGAAAAAAE
jgi:hypothetical protein